MNYLTENGMNYLVGYSQPWRYANRGPSVGGDGGEMPPLMKR